MTTTGNTLLTPGVWSQVATGSANVTIHGPRSSYRVFVGAAAPGPQETGIHSRDGEFTASGLTGTDNVYVMPYGASAATIVVLKS